MGSDPVSDVVISDHAQQAFLRARLHVKALHDLLNDVERVEDLLKENVQQIVADLGREIQHLI